MPRDALRPEGCTLLSTSSPGGVTLPVHRDEPDAGSPRAGAKGTVHVTNAQPRLRRCCRVDRPDAGGTSRRQFVGYVLAGTTLAVTADLAWQTAAPSTANAADAMAIPSNPTFSDEYDFLDLYRDSCAPTNHLLQIEVLPDGTASFALPRQDSGQGILTSFAQVIADELDMPIEQVRVFNSDARPELVWNQLTGGSTSHFSLWNAVKMSAATARTALATAAAQKWNVPVTSVTTRDGAVFGPEGQRATYGSLSTLAASTITKPLDVKLKSKPGKFVGQSVGRLDAKDDGHRQEAVHDGPAGRERAADDDLPGALAQRRPAVDREPRAGQGDAGRHRRRRDLHRHCRAGPHLRSVRRRHPRAAGHLGFRHDRQREQ